MKKWWAWVAALVVLVIAVLVGVRLLGGFGPDGAAGLTYTETTVATGTVSKTVFGSGVVRTADEYAVRTAAGGTITSVSVAEGQSVGPGDELFRVDGRPVYALEGAYPFYRVVSSSSDEGDDIVALQSMLRAVDVFDGETDGIYGPDTREAVRDFLEERGEERTSRVGPNVFQAVGPGDAYVASLQVEVGDVVAPGQTLLVTAPAGSMEADVAVNELDVRLVGAGARVDVTVDALPGEVLAATVSSVSSYPAGQTGGATGGSQAAAAGVVEYPVTIRFDEEVAGLLAGMSVDAEIVVDEVRDVLVVPATAVLDQEGADVVLVPTAGEDGLAELVPAEVEVGLRSESLVEIRGGLTEGQVIVLQVMSSADGSDEGGDGLFPGGVPGGRMMGVRQGIEGLGGEGAASGSGR